MRVLFLEPFFGGSHKAFALGLQNHSRHKIDLITMAPRFWKWRMRGAALYFKSRLPDLAEYDGIVCSSLMSLSDLKALLPGNNLPWVVYFHESQFDYPLSPGEQRDYQFGFTNIATAAAADHVLFNSCYHENSFFAGAGKFLKMMPEHHCFYLLDDIKQKSRVLYPGIEPGATALAADKRPKDTEKVPLILWNHRWEHDKGFEDFFKLLDYLISEEVVFQLALAGEHFQSVPKAFVKAKEKYADVMVHYGYIESFENYQKLLQKADLAISTSWQENFGISMVEAMLNGALPLMPNRLSYSEILPKPFHNDFLYHDFEDLCVKAKDILRHISLWKTKALALPQAVENFSWKNMAPRFDAFFDQAFG